MLMASLVYSRQPNHKDGNVLRRVRDCVQALQAHGVVATQANLRSLGFSPGTIARHRRGDTAIKRITLLDRDGHAHEIAVKPRIRDRHTIQRTVAKIEELKRHNIEPTVKTLRRLGISNRVQSLVKSSCCN